MDFAGFILGMLIRIIGIVGPNVPPGTDIPQPTVVPTGEPVITQELSQENQTQAGQITEIIKNSVDTSVKTATDRVTDAIGKNTGTVGEHAASNQTSANISPTHTDQIQQEVETISPTVVPIPTVGEPKENKKTDQGEEETTKANNIVKTIIDTQTGSIGTTVNDRVNQSLRYIHP